MEFSINTRSKHFPYLTGQCVKKLVNMTFSTASTQSSAKFSSIELFLKVMDFLLNYLKQKKIFEAFISTYFVNCDKNYVSYELYLI